MEDFTPEGSPETASTETESSQGTAAPEGQDLASASKEELQEMVEVALGSVKGKVPKDIADALKNYERGIQKKMKDTAAERKSFDESLKNPAALRRLMEQNGVDPYDFAEMTLSEKIEAMSKSPEQREHEETKKRLSDYEEREKAQKDAMEKEEYTRQEQAGMQSLDSEIAEAFKESGLPKDKFFVQKIAAEMLSAEKRGNPLTAKQAASKIKSWFSSSVKGIFDQLPAELIEEYLSPGARKKIREFDLKQVTAKALPGDQTKKSPGAEPASRPQKKETPMSEKEWRQWQQSLKS